MKFQKINIEHIPAIIWGEDSDKVYLYSHGKKCCKEDGEFFARKVEKLGYQVISFDYPEHGERKTNPEPWNIETGMRDLSLVKDYAMSHWKELSLYACSLGAYFSLLTLSEVPLRKCLFASPVLNMQHLIENMMTWSGVNEEKLYKEKRIPTEMGETLDWDYYSFVKAHPIVKWDAPTAILYGSEDNLTEREIVDEFVQRFHCDLTVSEGSEHYFHTVYDIKAIDDWMNEELNK